METKVANLTPRQFKKLVADVIDEKIEDLIEDYESLTSEKFRRKRPKPARQHG